ncbi:cupin domain-containing protein [Dyadobacter arcticus]|uniref:Quercetin dioxygenase-like cupin family protein n=1 Tax=Dyadobacter arcticus TaxID=1078754 RepID=A0ABX0UJ02_9BACT|nr:cupin domain-containing protein [Dyadobacter arcticus]NIJ52483.1 quercetin dioxygenase-like cupin family protein [Dyadobacter arcticus]
MKRISFISSLAVLASLPLMAFAKGKNAVKDIIKVFKTKAGEGRKHGHIQLKGVNSNVLDVKISGSDTNGGLAIFEQTSLSQGRGTPLHVHPSQDEIFYVIEGSYQFLVGGEKFSLTTGESIFLPRTVPHAWTQASPKGKMLVTMQPAGKLEDFFITMAALDHEPTPAEVAKIFEANEMKVVGPPLKLE